MALLLPKQRKQSLFSCSTTSIRRKTSTLNLESSTMLLRHTGTTSGGNVFPYSFPWACRRQPVTREMKQRAGEILSEALPSNSSGEEDRGSNVLLKKHATSSSSRGKTRSRVRAVPSHDDLDSSPSSVGAASFSSPKPHNVRDERRRGQPAHRGPRLLSELRGKLKEAAGHRIKTRRGHHVSTEARSPTRRQGGPEHVEAESSVQAFNTYEVNKKERSRRRRLQGRMPRQVLLFDTAASPKGFPATDGSDSDTLVHPCHAHATHRANSCISTSPVFSYKEGYSGIGRPSQRRMRPHQSSLPTLSGPVFTDVYSGIAYDTVDEYRHQQQQQQPHLHAAVPLSEQRQPNLQQAVTSRSPPLPNTNRDIHQLHQHSQRYASHPLSVSSRERGPCGKCTHKPATDAIRAELSPCGRAEGPFRISVDISVIRTIVHEAAALRIAWSLQNILRKHVSNAIALLRYKLTAFDSLYRISTRKGTRQSNLGRPEETSPRVLNTTVSSTREAWKWASTSLCTSGRKAGAASDVCHQVPKRLVWPSCCGCESDSFHSSVSRVGLGRVAEHTHQLHVAGARLLVHELRVLLVGPTTRLAWKQLKYLQEQQRLSQYVCKLYKSLKVTSQWAATFTRAAAAKIILRVAELAFQRCTLRALLLLKVPPPRLQRKRLAGACCASEPRSLWQCQTTAEMQGAAVLSIEEDNSPSVTSPLLGKRCFSSTSLSDKTLKKLGVAAPTFSVGGIRRTQAVGRVKECVERQQFEREARRPPCNIADDTNALPCSAAITAQPRSTLDCVKVQATAAAILGSTCSRLNGGSTQSTETEGRTHNREDVSGVTDTPVSSRESRDSGNGSSKRSEGQVHKVLHPVRAPPSTDSALSGPITQRSQAHRTEDQTGTTVVVCKSLTRGNPGDDGQQKRTNHVIERSSPSPFLPLNASVKSMPSASTALAIDEVATSPAPFTQDKLRVAGVRE